MPNNIEETKTLINRDFEIELTSEMNSEEAIIEMLALRVADMIDGDIDLLLSYLYRLDVEESKINFILNQQATIPAHTGLAQLIWNRQKERLATKKKYGKGDMIDGFEF